MVTIKQLPPIESDIPDTQELFDHLRFTRPDNVFGCPRLNSTVYDGWLRTVFDSGIVDAIHKASLDVTLKRLEVEVNQETFMKRARQFYHQGIARTQLTPEQSILDFSENIGGISAVLFPLIEHMETRDSRATNGNFDPVTDVERRVEFTAAKQASSPEKQAAKLRGFRFIVAKFVAMREADDYETWELASREPRDLAIGYLTDLTRSNPAEQILVA